ncbi:uncharacterized protein TNCV_1004661 [Trichonephila clavipes]|nr:uncharacterized protein TNCV_1004661 [Trichonephila clavipes]
MSRSCGSNKTAQHVTQLVPQSMYRKTRLGEGEGRLTSHCSAARGLLATDHVILNHGQVTWTTPELAPPLLTTTPHQREDVSALDRFSVHRCPTRRVFSGTGLELVTKPATIRCLYHSATAATRHSLVYADKPQTLDDLEDNIRRVIADIRPQMLEKSRRKLDVQIGLHPSQPWQSYTRNHI